MMSPRWSTFTPSDSSPARESPPSKPEESRFQPTIHLLDPEPVRSARLKQSLSSMAAVHCHRTPDSLTSGLLSAGPTMVLVQVDWAQGSTSPALEFLRKHGRQVLSLVYADTTGVPIGLYCQPLAAGARQVLNLGAPNFLETLCETVRRFAGDLRTQAEEEGELAGLFASYGILSCSQAMREVLRRVQKASHFSDLPVLILGETGTGKQRLAEAIHAMDPRRADKPFITLNCGALSKTLAEAELFGHARGAFSGAAGERKGLFRAANGGTLLLDEIGELDPELQPKLLRVLQERRLLPVGEDYEQPVDVRIIAATHRSLETMIETGKFREDLYQRLNVFRISIPPLRERPDDIAHQARAFLARHAAERGVPVSDFGPRVLEALCSLPWEGNTRQLENFLREALVQKDGTDTTLDLADLPRWIIERLAFLPPAADQGMDTSVDALVEQACARKLSFGEAVEDYEKRLLVRILELTGGNKTQAAARLGITSRTIFTKIKKYQIEG